VPVYTVQDKKTKKAKELWMSWDELQEYLVENPTKEHVLVPVHLIDPMAIKKRDPGFERVLNRMKGFYKGNTIE